MHKPMLAEAAKEPFNDPNWVFEPKWDGVRAISYGGQLVTRTGNNITRQFPELILPADAVLDGEIVVLNSEGNPDFPAVSGRVHPQNRTIIGARSRVRPALFMAFDILERRGESLIRQPLVARRELLVATIPTGRDAFRMTPQITGRGIELFARLRDKGMEGIMAKRLSSLYQPGIRSRDWLKIKVSRHGVFWVIGATIGEGRRDGLIGALVLAVEDSRFIGEKTDLGLVPVGEVGTGFNDEELKALTCILQGLRVDRPPVKATVEKLWFWTEPSFKVKVSYLERTADGRLRFPSYQGRA